MQQQVETRLLRATGSAGCLFVRDQLWTDRVQRKWPVWWWLQPCAERECSSLPMDVQAKWVVSFLRHRSDWSQFHCGTGLFPWPHININGFNWKTDLVGLNQFNQKVAYMGSILLAFFSEEDILLFPHIFIATRQIYPPKHIIDHQRFPLTSYLHGLRVNKQ